MSLILFGLRSIYMSNCLHWTTFFFTSGSHLCISLETIIYYQNSYIGKMLSVDLLKTSAVIIGGLSLLFRNKNINKMNEKFNIDLNSNAK